MCVLLFSSLNINRRQKRGTSYKTELLTEFVADLIFLSSLTDLLRREFADHPLPNLDQRMKLNVTS